MTLTFPPSASVIQEGKSFPSGASLSQWVTKVEVSGKLNQGSGQGSPNKPPHSHVKNEDSVLYHLEGLFLVIKPRFSK